MTSGHTNGYLTKHAVSVGLSTTLLVPRQEKEHMAHAKQKKNKKKRVTKAQQIADIKKVFNPPDTALERGLKNLFGFNKKKRKK